MDYIDLKIILLLMNNSRLTYRDIANYLDLSVNAIYKRVQTLTELKIIQGFTASIKSYAINALYVFIFGQSENENMDEVIKVVGAHQNTWQIIRSSRNYIYIGSILKSIHQLEDYSQFIADKVDIKSPNVGILSGVYYNTPIPYIVPKSKSMSYDQLDTAIIRSLHNDSRKPITEVADEVRSTPNTVRRRLNRLIEEGIIDLSIKFNPEASNDIFAVFQITINPSIDKSHFADEIIKNYHPNLFYIWTFSNLPNLLHCWCWTNNMKEMYEMIEEIKKDEIESILFDIMYRVNYYDTWKEKMLYD